MIVLLKNTVHKEVESNFKVNVKEPNVDLKNTNFHIKKLFKI